MATAIGDLVVSLGLENQQFVAALNTSGANLDEFAGHAEAGSHGMTELGERSEEGGASATGASRAFGFLGKHLEELGEHIGTSNKGLGETVSGLGSTVAGVGETVHGYHALHTALEVATAAQAALNAISPIGWALLAAGAVAATVAYIKFSDGEKEAAEAEKKLAEEQKKAMSETESTLENLRKKVENLNESPLGQFRNELMKTKIGITDIRDKLYEFKDLQDKLDKDTATKKLAKEHDAIDKELAARQRDLDQSGMGGDTKFALNLAPEATKQQHERAENIAREESLLENQKKWDSFQESKRQRAVAEAHSLIDSAQSPIDRLMESERKLVHDFREGLIDRTTYSSALSALAHKTEEDLKPKHKQEENTAALDFGSAQAYEEISKRLNPEENQEPAKQTAENTAKMHALLQEINKQLAATPMLR